MHHVSTDPESFHNGTMHDPFAPYCTGKIGSRDRQALSSQPIGSRAQVTCPKCRSLVGSIVTPLRDVQLLQHHSPRIEKLYDLQQREADARKTAKEIEKLDDEFGDDSFVTRF